MNSSIFSNVMDFAASRGFLVKQSSQNFTNLPFTMFPSPIPKNCFLEVNKIQPLINELMFLISQDVEFLSESLESVVKADEYTRNLFQIFQEVQAFQNKSLFQLGILRSDYMFDYSALPNEKPSFSPKQIEVNTVAASFGGLGGDIIRSIHCKSLKESNKKDDIDSLPENPSRVEIARGLFEGWNAYAKSEAVIVFLVHQSENNIFDQRAIEYAINSFNEDVVVRRKHFDNFIQTCRIDENGNLFLDNEEVAVVYFRDGYAPHQYLTPEHWQVRLLIEKSRAIKCPDVALQLVGCKKIQEILARPGVIEKYIKEPEAAAMIRNTFAGLYTFDMNEEGDETVRKALMNPDAYVMKPQREGGGNNVYGSDIVDLLHKIGSTSERCAYILMDLIRPKTNKNHTVVKGKLTEANLISEMGVYGVFLAKNGKLLINNTAGHLLRSKPDDENEGGVTVGIAAIDSPLLQ